MPNMLLLRKLETKTSEARGKCSCRYKPLDSDAWATRRPRLSQGLTKSCWRDVSIDTDCLVSNGLGYLLQP